LQVEIAVHERVSKGELVIRSTEGKLRTYHLRKYQRSNQSTCIDQRPSVVKGQRVHKNDVIADSSSTERGPPSPRLPDPPSPR
jgi:DNA-directed RNA polymerase subunit beta